MKITAKNYSGRVEISLVIKQKPLYLTKREVAQARNELAGIVFDALRELSHFKFAIPDIRIRN